MLEKKIIKIIEKFDIKLLKHKRIIGGNYFDFFSYYFDGNIQYIMTINGEIQFDSLYEYYYHDYLSICRNYILNNSNILVLGGGDFLLSRFLKDYNVTLVDISKEIVNYFSKNKEFLKINKYNNNFKVIVNDAVEYINNLEEKFDYIIIDFPIFIDNNLIMSKDELSSKDFINQINFLKKIKKLLTPNGKITMQADMNKKYDIFLKNILKCKSFYRYSLNIEKIIGHEYEFYCISNEKLKLNIPDYTSKYISNDKNVSEFYLLLEEYYSKNAQIEKLFNK